jgi:predicted TIM-barrel fold metal-dependent hydrolase
VLDANVHATRDGRWFDTGHDASVGRLLGEMDEARVDRAALVAVPGLMTTEDVLATCADHPDRLLPVGAFAPQAWDSPASAARAARAELKDRGLLGFKLHPRLGGYDPLDARVLAVLEEAAAWEQRPAVWICTLLRGPGLRLRKGAVDTLSELVHRHPEITFVLAHGGGPELLALATAVRAAPNAYLDLSFTLTHFHGSSVDLDLRHLMRTFDNRLLFGSDFPEARIPEARAICEGHAAEADPAALPKLLGANLLRATGAAVAVRV